MADNKRLDSDQDNDEPSVPPVQLRPPPASQEGLSSALVVPPIHPITTNSQSLRVQILSPAQVPESCLLSENGQYVSYMHDSFNQPIICFTPERHVGKKRSRTRVKLENEFRSTKMQELIYDDLKAKGPSRDIAPSPFQAEGYAGLPRVNENHGCAGCGSKTHLLMTCLQAGPDGLMTGCPKCNTLDHSFAQCVHLQTDMAKLEVLIEGRGNMPAFQNVRAWANIVEIATWTGFKSAFCERVGRLNSFPWSPSFTHTMKSQIPYLQAEMDKPGSNAFNGLKLPADPTTQDWASIQRTLAHPRRGRI
ncbi:hypothetical protein NW762_006542 [Fusarium torreyae]|uniref:Uncharacterized protein n=1 Tax=Fusarium torreyae TaxID=1237075 RepID=A0A9W8S0A2_9HYPO|nr:hypothetical protein NW762_006542 [Fusarium torreyae]